MRSRDGVTIRGWTQTYEVIGGPSHWKVRSSTLHSGTEVLYPPLPNKALQTDGVID